MEAYIADKAGELGADVQVNVTCDMDETGFPYPVEVTVTGTLTAEQQSDLSRIIEADFAVVAEQQKFIAGEGDAS